MPNAWRNVLQHEERADEVEAARRLTWQCAALDERYIAQPGLLGILSGMSKHGWCDVAGHDSRCPPRQGQREPARPASEVESRGEWNLPAEERGDGCEERRDVRFARLEVHGRSDAAAADVGGTLAGEDGKVRLAAGQLLPVSGTSF